jgi:hypothetical protein
MTHLFAHHEAAVAVAGMAWAVPYAVAFALSVGAAWLQAHGLSHDHHDDHDHEGGAQ